MQRYRSELNGEFIHCVYDVIHNNARNPKASSRIILTTFTFSFSFTITQNSARPDGHNIPVQVYCYRWSCFEAKSKICSAERQAKIREKNKVKFRTSSKIISFVCNILVYCEGVDFRVTFIKFITVFIKRRDAFSWSYKHSAALSPWEQYILCPFRHTSIRQLLCLMRLKTVKLA